MSVLITGIDMPKTCRECPLEQPYDGYNCAITGKSYSWALSEIPSDCPLIPVPDHGRLVDADEFLDRAIGTKCFRGDYALMLEELVGESTTIIPAEPHRGEA